MIDTSKIFYDLAVILPNGDKVRLAPVLRSLSWEENDGELAVRLEAEIQNKRMKDGKWLHQKISLGSRVVLLAEWGEGWKEIFRGTVFSWDYRTDPLGHFMVTAYDQLIYLTKSKDDRYYKTGMTAKAIIQDIAKAWGIPLGNIEGPDAALAKQVFRGDTLADMIFSVLDQAKKRGAGKWIVRSKQGKIDIIRPGQNSPVYCFTADTNVDSIEDRQDIEDLVTRVKIVGAENSEGRAPVVTQLDGRTEFGTLQEVVYQRQFDTLAAAKSAAEDILSERGQPRHRRKVLAPDLPFLRKGDKVKVVAGTLNGYYIVSSIIHDVTNRIMVMEVEDVD
jgi:hypothetical protein